MRKVILILSFGVCSNFVISQADTLQISQELKEVVIRGKKNDKGKTADIQLQESTDKLLALLPQITMIKRGNYALEPTIRGLSGGQITTTIDGMQMFGACTDKMDIISSYIEPTNLEKIELTTSPNENQTGSTVGGGINFSLLKAKLEAPRKFSGEVGLGYETNANYFQTLGKFQYSTKRFAVLLNGIYRNADNYHTAKRREVKYSQFEKWNAQLNMVAALNEQNHLSLDYIQDEGYNIGYPALTMDVGYAKAYISALTHNFKNTSGAIRNVETKLFFNYISHAMDDSNRPIEEIPMRMDMPGTSRTFGAFSKARIVVKRHLMNLQINAFQNDYHAEMTMYPEVGSEMFMLTVPDAQRRTLGIQFVDKWIASSTFNLLFGGRSEVNYSGITTDIGRNTITSFYNGDPSSSRMTGNLFVQPEFRFFKNFTVYAAVNYSQRPPTLEELYGFYLFNRGDNYDYIGNPEMKNEASLNGTLGIKMDLEKVSVSLEGFCNSFSNYITGTLLPEFDVMNSFASGVKQYDNISSALLTGAELTFHWEIVRGLMLHSVNSYTYGIDNERDFLPLVPPFKSANSLGYHWKGFGFRIEYIGALAQNNVNTEKYGEYKTPSYSVVNFFANKLFTIKDATKLNVEVGFENIFDVEYYEHLDVMKVPRQGFNFIARVGIRF